MILQSIRARLTAWTALVLSVVMIAAGVVTYALVRRALARSADDGIAAAAGQLAHSLADEAEERGGVGDDETVRAVVTELRDSPFAVELETPDGRRIATSNPAVSAAIAGAVAGRVRGQSFGYGTVTAAQRYRFLLRPVSAGGSRLVAVVARPLAAEDDLLGRLRDAMLLTIPLTLLVASGGGWILARKSLAPVAKMSREAAAIGAADLGRRIDVPNPQDELGQLATTLNSLLQRLDDAFGAQRSFMADASHELRSPVTILQGEIDVALAADVRDAAEYRQSLEVMQRSVRRLARIVGDLFLLARSDAGDAPVVRERLYLEEIVAETVRSFRTLAAERHVDLHERHDDELAFEGDGDLLQRMVGNLVDNAIHHTPAGGCVSVTTTVDGSAYVITVADEGDGIPPEFQDAVFDRFVRVDPARRSRGAHAGGAGLGLPIARWVASVHGGTLALRKSDEHGSLFVITLPRTSL